ncbi:ABA4-like family protein [Nonlabens antarcticus]|uniref:ABA4-like family protein n=1 Tax=Nonlabens antarcticus TaxID=392714 RepID=UPI0018918FBD|nr:ABA4-like family protein [Nonlabens antarcticus]
MTPTLVFSIVNILVLPMWILMIFLPNWKPTRFLINYKIIPVVLGIIYAIYLIQALAANGMMDFGSLESIMGLFTTETAVLTGWIHYLAFDLLVGMWMVDQNRSLGISKWLMAPNLLGTFMFGPVGFLLFMILKSIKEKRSQKSKVPMKL